MHNTSQLYNFPVALLQAMLMNTLSSLAGEGERWACRACHSEYLCCLIIWALEDGGGHKLGNRVQQMLCLLSYSLRPPTVSFPFLWPMLPEKSNHAHFPAWLVPRAEAATFPSTGSSAMAAAVAAPEHWAMKAAALQQVFKLATLSPISLPPDTHMNSACPSTEI